MRRFKATNFRVVVSGDSRGPAENWVEYTVSDGTMFEPPKHTERAAVDSKLTVDQFWALKVGAVKELEEVSW